MADQPNESPSDSESSEEELLGLEGFSQPDDDGGLSLEALSAAYAELIDRGAVPYEDPGDEPEPDDQEAEAESSQDEFAEQAGEIPAGLDSDLDPDPDADRDCEISPKSILESMLFVGNSHNEALTSKQVASLMRGVRPHEIDELIRELNADYQRLGCPYSIVASGGGYVLQLDESYRRLRDKFYKRVRDARLSQAAIDVLAIVAYRQPLNREEIDRLRARPSGGILSQLVRRQLLRLERPEETPRRPLYHTTDRFLQLFGLSNLGELPQSQEIDCDL